MAPVGALETAVAVLTRAADAGACVVLSAHVQPDADALGSTLALAEGLRRRGARVTPTFPGPFVLPASLAWLPGADRLVPATEVPTHPDLVVGLDAADLRRLGELGAVLTAAPASLVVDHHASNPGFGQVQLVDPEAAGTVVLVADLLAGLGVELDTDIATCLYAGLAADTGSFRFGNTSPATHQFAARLLATGIDHARISQRLFDTAPFGWLALLSLATGRATLERATGRGLVWTWATVAEAEGHGLAGDHLEALVDVVRSAEEADVACVLKGTPDGAWNVSLRSRGGTDVSAVAIAMGGGGHRMAAGFTSHLDREQTVAAIRARL
ncbi:phosphoesterase RecJ domain-containing protein [Klenkia marina]|uniref:Phosphoesterase RecJ domain-containing protein n=1 Tax=Klenkia marina TaxID=1960309 RepID=A0A1G4YJ99_9ACTN|nr:phosphoesterase RecJ domain-containing protein [Klenkia marina]